MRVDARRNRAAVLAAARTLVSERGSSVGMDEIAQAAGVAVGTLYRHFPTKADLVQAVVEDSVGRIADETATALDDVRAGADVAATFEALFRTVARAHSTDLALKDAARGIGVLVPDPHGDTGQSPEFRRALGLIDEVLAIAVAAGALDPSTTATDLAVLLDGVPLPELGEAQRERYVDVVLRGLLTARAPARPAAGT